MPGFLILKRSEGYLQKIRGVAFFGEEKYE
jgi:hypothetical protein